MSRKIALAAAVAAVALLTVAGLLVYAQFSSLHEQIADLQAQNRELENSNSELQAQNTELQNKTKDLQEQLDQLLEQIAAARKVMITGGSSKYGWINAVGMTMLLNIDITIENTGNASVEGLILEVKRAGFNEDPRNATRSLGAIQPNEATVITDSFAISMDYYFSEPGLFNYVANLKLGNLTVDSRSITITERQF